MPIELSIDTGRDLITRIVRDPVTVDEYAQSLENVLTHPDYHPGMKSLTDLREASHKLTAEDIQRIARVLVINPELRRHTRAAIVVSKAVSYGLSRMLQMQLEGEGLPVEVSLFYDADEARQWLGVT